MIWTSCSESLYGNGLRSTVRTVLKIAVATLRPVANKTTTIAEKAKELRICRRTRRTSSRRLSHKLDAIALGRDIPSYR